MSDLRTSRLYELYCRFTEELNKAVRASGTRVSDVKATSYSEFMAVWSSLSGPRRKSWEHQFEAGFADVAKAEHQALRGAFAPNEFSERKASSLRAA
jgi:hypothetical protein